MRAAVAERDQHIRVDEVVLHQIDVHVELRQDEFDVEIVLDGQIEEGVDCVGAALPRDIGDGAAF
jgi:hypothetical protein